MDEGTRVLARRPPLGLLGKVCLLLLAAMLPLSALIQAIHNRGDFVVPGANWLLAAFVGFLALTGLSTLGLLLWALRVLSRFFLAHAGIYVRESTILFRIPCALKWWSPLYRLAVTEIPLADLRRTQFTVATKSRWTIQTDHAAIEIPAATFRIGSYTLDTELREILAEKLPGGRLAPTLAPLRPERAWVASRGRRLAMVIVGLLLIVALVAGFAWLPGNEAAIESFSKLCAAPFILGAAMIALSFLYRGRLIVDPRGFFYENGGAVCFLSWEALSQATICITSPALGLGLWQDLDIRSQCSFLSGAKYRIRFNRILGLGFPLREIESVLTTRSRTNVPSAVNKKFRPIAHQ